ncbi:MAG TPA: TIGR03435 family protein [Candidatus Acidoferrales bacterium]|nr:TIGR03435 family protein [Candidatus Acidoferrales bacterium]
MSRDLQPTKSLLKQAISVVALTLLPVCGIQLRAQSQAYPPKFQFEVATFKMDKAGGSTSWELSENALVVKNATLQNLVLNAYDIANYQLKGSPGWLNSERYDVEAKMDSFTADAFKGLTPRERGSVMREMLQELLAERLNLSVRRDKREMPVYFLVVAKNGPKFKVSDKPESTRQYVVNGELTMEAQGIPLSDITNLFTITLKRPVVDTTGLSGRYDLKLSWRMDDRSGEPAGADLEEGAMPIMSATVGSSIFTALQEQLGLKLEPGNAPVDFIVIDHVERPSSN